jgi:toxin ParE1/3/4
MAKIFKVRKKADSDLQKIYIHSIKEFGPIRADKYIHDIENIFKDLTKNSMMGRDCSHIKPKLRAFPVETHTIYYKVQNYGVAIIRILHQSMNEKNHLH